MRKREGWRVVSGAKMGIVCFRYEEEDGRVRSEEEWDELNGEVSRRCIKSNRAAALTTRLEGRTVIRICSIHPEMTVELVKEVVRSLDEVAKEVAREA